MEPQWGVYPNSVTCAFKVNGIQSLFPRKLAHFINSLLTGQDNSVMVLPTIQGVYSNYVLGDRENDHRAVPWTYWTPIKQARHTSLLLDMIDMLPLSSGQNKDTLKICMS